MSATRLTLHPRGCERIDAHSRGGLPAEFPGDSFTPSNRTGRLRHLARLQSPSSTPLFVTNDQITVPRNRHPAGYPRHCHRPSGLARSRERFRHSVGRSLPLRCLNVSVHVGSHANGRVPEHVRDNLDRHSLSEHDRSGRVPQLVRVPMPEPRGLGHRGEVATDVRGSIGVPMVVVNTWPESRQTGPAASRSVVCRFLCARSEATTNPGRLTARRELVVFTSPSTSLPASRLSWCRTTTTAPLRSTSSQRSPSASPRRKPVPSIVTYSASSRCPLSTAKRRFASATVSERPSVRRAFGAVLRVATLRPTISHRWACVSA